VCCAASRPGVWSGGPVTKRALALELETWLPIHPGIHSWESTVEEGRTRWVFRRGTIALRAEDIGRWARGSGYTTNFDCNLRCDYCCVSLFAHSASTRPGLERVRRIASEAAELGVGEFFVTAVSPFSLPDIGEILTACAAAAADDSAHQRYAVRGAAPREPPHITA